MKATTTAIGCAKSARDTLLRTTKAVEDATKRLGELQASRDKTPRVQAAIEAIQAALKTADIAHKVCRRLALSSLALAEDSIVELGDSELAALAYGMEDK